MPSLGRPVLCKVAHRELGSWSLLAVCSSKNNDRPKILPNQMIHSNFDSCLQKQHTLLLQSTKRHLPLLVYFQIKFQQQQVKLAAETLRLIMLTQGFNIRHAHAQCRSVPTKFISAINDNLEPVVLG